LSSWTSSARASSWCTASPARTDFKALEAHPDKVKALVALSRRSPATRTRFHAHEKAPFVRNRRQCEGAAALVEDTLRRRRIRERAEGRGGSVDFVDLPDLGIKGNSHMMMINKNSDQIAGLIGKWLSSKGFCD